MRLILGWMVYPVSQITLCDQAGQTFFISKFVIDTIHANGFESVVLLGKAVFLKTRHGKLAAIDVARFIVEHPPVRIFPT